MKKQRGQELIEFALVLPAILLIILGALGVTTMVSSSTQITQAASRAALDATNVGSTSCRDAFDAAQAAIREIITSNAISVTNLKVNCQTPSSGHTCSSPGDALTDTVSCGNDSLTGGNLLTVTIQAGVNLTVFGTGPSLPLSSTGASIVPRS